MIKFQNYQTGYILSSPTWIMTYLTYRTRQLIFSALKPASIPASLNDVDLPEYKQEIRYRLNGEKPDDIFYVRMGKHTKEYMMGFYSDIFTGDDGHRYHVLVLRNENTLPDIDP